MTTVVSSTLLQEALAHPIWMAHQLGDRYHMKGAHGEWKLAYYPIFSDGKTGEPYDEPRALMERPSVFEGVEGIDLREVPLRYITKLTES